MDFAVLRKVGRPPRGLSPSRRWSVCSDEAESRNGKERGRDNPFSFEVPGLTEVSCSEDRAASCALLGSACRQQTVPLTCVNRV